MTSGATLRAIAEDAARQLVAVSSNADGVFVRTPLLYSSGSCVVVRIDGSGDTFFVSDYGLGHSEAELAGAHQQFQRCAPAVAKAAGVSFDRHSFFVARSSRAQLPGVIASVANTSKEAADLALIKLAEKKDVEEKDRLYDILVDTFTRDKVTKNAELIGASSHKWHVTALVHVNDNWSIFERVHPVAASIYSANSMFHDVARLDDAPKRVAVVEKREAFGDYLGILSQAASIIESSASRETFWRLAA